MSLEKGKGRAAEVIGFSPRPSQPTFHLPSLAVACLDSAEHWPKRILPGNLDSPEPCQFRLKDKDQVSLGAKTAVQLGDLLLKLIEWTLVPHIDLTGEQLEMGFQPPPDTTVLLSGSKLPSKVIFLIADSTAYSVYIPLYERCPNYLCHDVFSSGEGVGESPRRTAFQEAIRATVSTRGCWKAIGDTMVPDTSPVTNAKYWRVTGVLLALALLSGENLHPVSPVVAYALLANVHRHSEAATSMHLSLSFIEQLEDSKAKTLLPWMIIPPHKDWRELPSGHRAQLLQVITNFDLNVRLNVYSRLLPYSQETIL